MAKINLAVGVDDLVFRPLNHESSWQFFEEPTVFTNIHPLEDINRTGWDRMIATKTYGLIEPDPYVVEKLEEFKKSGIKKVLDLGCGQGRHTLLLAREGFHTWALDISHSAVSATQTLLDREGLNGKVVQGNMIGMDYPSSYFDGVLAWRVLYLEKLAGVKKAFAEVSRILRPGGLLYASIRSTNNTLCHLGKLRGTEIEHNTYEMKEEGLTGLIYHFFDKQEVLSYLPGFKILELKELELQHTEYTARYPEYNNLFWVVLARKL